MVKEAFYENIFRYGDPFLRQSQDFPLEDLDLREKSTKTFHVRSHLTPRRLGELDFGQGEFAETFFDKKVYFEPVVRAEIEKPGPLALEKQSLERFLKIERLKQGTRHWALQKMFSVADSRQKADQAAVEEINLRRLNDAFSEILIIRG